MKKEIKCVFGVLKIKLNYNYKYMSIYNYKMSKTMNENMKITSTRTRVEYDITEQMIMKNSKNIVLLEIENKILKGESVIYDNQEKCSLSIVSNLHNKKLINIMITALTQSGKTGTMSD